jgi:hypothetical protein
LSENVVVGIDISVFLVAFLSQDSDTARTSGLAECAKAVNQIKLGRRLLMLTCMKPRFLRLQKSTNESAWGMRVVLVVAVPGLTSTSPEEQRRSRIRLRLKAIRTGRLVRSEQSVKGADFWAWKNRFNA